MTLTDNAARALLDLVGEKQRGDGLRIGIEKGGCAGLQYAMNVGFAKPGDVVVEHLGARAFIDPESLAHLDKCTLDYEDGLVGAGFRIQNPQAARSCGCGTSFEPGAPGKEG